nr:piRNA biogenesis protein EXD1 isoform X3 [Oryctolagus cuniculus]
MDPSSDYHFLNQILWRRVRLTLVCGAFEGVLQHVDPNRIVVLKKVKNVETGRSVPGVKMFFGHEIVNVELLDEVEQGPVREKAPSVSLNMERTSVDKMQDEDPSVCEPASPDPGAPPISLLNDLKYSASEEEEVTYTVIDQFQQKFGAAMLHIKKQSVLSVAVEGANVCRHGKLCWLQVASNSRVYLFDIFLLGRRAFNNGLQMILEDKRILKVIHDCRWLSDCLSHQYGIMLNNVFDTQVADVLQFSMETGGFLPNCISTLQESLIRHLKVAPKHLSFLEERQKLIQPTCMELPQELLQLKDFQKQRREKAAKEYSVNAQGLLIRSVLHPKKSVTETAGKEGKVRGFLLCKNSRVDQAPDFTSRESRQGEKFLKVEMMNKETTTRHPQPPSLEQGEARDGSSTEAVGSENPRVAQNNQLVMCKQDFQASSLKEEIEQLLTMESKEGLQCTKQGVSVSSGDTSHPSRKSALPTLPPCPALEKTDSWINLSPGLA